MAKRPLVPSRDSRATFDLAYLDTLSGELGHILLVSERTQYLLNNLVVADIADPERYSLGWYYNSYVPLREPGDEWDLFGDVVESARRELIPTMYDGDLKQDMERLIQRVGPVAPVTAGVTQTLSAGTNIVDVLTVGSGRIYEFTQTTIRMTSGSCTNVYLSVFRSNGTLHTYAGPIVLNGANYHYDSQQIWIGQGDVVRSYWYGASAGAVIEHRLALVGFHEYTAIL